MEIKQTIITIFILFFTVVNLGCTKDSSQGEGAQAGSCTDALFAIQIEKYTTRNLDITFDSEITEGQFNNFTFVMSRRIASLLVRERISKAYYQLTEDINNKFAGKVSAERAPEGIRIKILPITYSSKSKNDINNECQKLKKDLLDSFTFLEEVAFDKNREHFVKMFRKTTILSFKKGKSKSSS